MRAAMNAIFYLLRTGWPWRYLPRDSFPPRSTVYNIFRDFQRDGVWEAIWAELHCGSRQPIGQIGGKGGGTDNQVGYDAGKQVNGRKRGVGMEVCKA
jgi:hypothetical protein